MPIANRRLTQAERSYADLLADALSHGVSEQPKCKKCGGTDLREITSRRIGESQKQRMECRACGHRDWHIEHRARITPRN